ncbi:MAG: hypothetical protein QW199_00955 [Candidatus Pacearchaeota archaeon]
MLGYDEKRPSAKDYDKFIESFVDGLNSLCKYKNKKLSFIAYGSYVNKKNFVPGRSDIDAFLVFFDKFVIDKAFLSEVAEIFSSSLTKAIPLHFRVFDIETLIDGRFNTFEPSFKKIINSGIVLFGEDCRGLFCYERAILDGQVRLRYDLRDSRSGLFYYQHSKNERAIIENFYKTLEYLRRVPQNLLCMLGEYFDWVEACEEIKQREQFKFNHKTLDKVINLLLNPRQLDKIYRNKAQVIALWKDVVTCFEELIASYVLAYPK